MKIVLAFLILSSSLIAVTSGQDLFQEASRLAVQMLCKMMTGVNDDLTNQVRNLNFTSNDSNLKKYVFCVFKRLTIMTRDGNINKERVLMNLPPELNRDKFISAVDKCNNQNSTDIAERAYNTIKCYYKEYPNNVKIL